MSSLVLTVFSVSLIIFQLSCKKDSIAQTPSTVLQLEKVIFKKVINSGGTTIVEIWTAKYDGTSAAKVNIALPSGVLFSDDMTPMFSPDGQKIFFTASSEWGGNLYVCNADGSGVSKIVDKGGSDNNIILGGAY